MYDVSISNFEYEYNFHHIKISMNAYTKVSEIMSMISYDMLISDPYPKVKAFNSNTKFIALRYFNLFNCILFYFFIFFFFFLL